MVFLQINTASSCNIIHKKGCKKVWLLHKTIIIPINDDLFLNLIHPITVTNGFVIDVSWLRFSISQFMSKYLSFQ